MKLSSVFSNQRYKTTVIVTGILILIYIAINLFVIGGMDLFTASTAVSLFFWLFLTYCLHFLCGVWLIPAVITVCSGAVC